MMFGCKYVLSFSKKMIGSRDAVKTINLEVYDTNICNFLDQSYSLRPILLVVNIDISSY
jgi:hypothetical protein